MLFLKKQNENIALLPEMHLTEKARKHILFIFYFPVHSSSNNN